MNLESLAKIGAGTKRKKRDINLLEVSEEIKSLYENYNSLNKVAEIVKLSPEMVREFLKIPELEEEVKDLIRLNKIDSVDIGYRISKINGDDQIVLAKNIVKKNLTSDDVRAVVRFKIDNPGLPIETVIDRVLNSKNKKVYVAYLEIEENVFEELSKKLKGKDLTKFLREKFRDIVPEKLIDSFELKERLIILKVVQDAPRMLRNKAKALKIPLANLANEMIKEYLERN